MIDVLLLLGLIVFALAGVILTIFQLPGGWLIILAALLYDWHYAWQRFGWKWLAALIAVALAAEALEALGGFVAARKAGASRRAMIGSLIGAIAGMLLFSIPVPVIGTLIGGLAGCFLGALIAEMSLHDDLQKGARVGIWATAGRLLGTLSKTAAALAIAGGVTTLATIEWWRTLN